MNFISLNQILLKKRYKNVKTKRKINKSIHILKIKKNPTLELLLVKIIKI